MSNLTDTQRGRHRCRDCKGLMHVAVPTKKRRSDGPLGWRYGIIWHCRCGHKCWTKVTKKDWEFNGGTTRHLIWKEEPA